MYKILAILIVLPSLAMAQDIVLHPAGYDEFCKENKGFALCMEHQYRAEHKATLEEIEKINIQVNTEIKPLSDELHYGTPDKWAFPVDGYGDCEDVVLQKAKILYNMNYDPYKVRIIIGSFSRSHGKNDLHAVLGVTINNVEYVLDNLQNDVVKLSDYKTFKVILKQKIGTNKWE